MIDPSIARPRAAAGRPRRHLRLVSTDRPVLATDPWPASSIAQTLEPADGLFGGTSENAPGILTAAILKALFCVMKMRLRMTASECLLSVPPDTEPLRRELLRDRILECSQGLDELHAALMPDIVRLHEIERELLVVSADLTRPRP